MSGIVVDRRCLRCHLTCSHVFDPLLIQKNKLISSTSVSVQKSTFMSCINCGFDWEERLIVKI